MCMHRYVYSTIILRYRINDLNSRNPGTYYCTATNSAGSSRPAAAQVYVSGELKITLSRCRLKKGDFLIYAVTFFAIYTLLVMQPGPCTCMAHNLCLHHTMNSHNVTEFSKMAAANHGNDYTEQRVLCCGILYLAVFAHKIDIR